MDIERCGKSCSAGLKSLPGPRGSAMLGCRYARTIPVLILATALLLPSGSLFAQIGHWTKVSTGDLECDFPDAYTAIQFSGASGYYFQGADIYMTVTAIPDTFPMKGNLERDYSRDFAQVVLQTSRKLQGRVREYRDTVIGNRPAYISRQEVSMPDGRKTYYDLLQVLHQDSIRAFSSQYFIDDKEAAIATARFFDSVRMRQPKSGKKGPGKYGAWIIGAIFGIVAIAVLIKRLMH